MSPQIADPADHRHPQEQPVEAPGRGLVAPAQQPQERPGGRQRAGQDRRGGEPAPEKPHRGLDALGQPGADFGEYLLHARQHEDDDAGNADHRHRQHHHGIDQ